jgi:hypothetical protein
MKNIQNEGKTMSQFESMDTENIWNSLLKPPTEEELARLETTVMASQIFGEVVEIEKPRDDIYTKVETLILDKIRNIIFAEAQRSAEVTIAKEARKTTSTQARFGQELAEIAIELDIDSPCASFLKCLAVADRAGARKVVRGLLCEG